MRVSERRSTTKRASVHSIAQARRRRRERDEAKLRRAIDEPFKAGIAPDSVEGEGPTAF